MIRSLHARPLRLPFRQRFTHAAQIRHTTETIWVEAVSDAGCRGIGEGCPRRYVTGETLESALEFIRDIEPQVRQLNDFSTLCRWVTSNSLRIDRHPAAWCAVELALLDLFARHENQSIERLLKRPAVHGIFNYTAVLGAEPPDVFSVQCQRYRDLGFRHFKIKLTGVDHDDRNRMAAFRDHINQVDSLRFDANNAWHDLNAATHALQALAFPYLAVEEPLNSRNYDDLRQLAQTVGTRIILDESFLRFEQLEYLLRAPSRWILNLRISKLGGLIRSLAIADRAAAAGIPFIIGCQVGETSLLTRAALTVAAGHRGDNLLGQEGAFGSLLLERDPFAPCLTFTQGGELDTSSWDFPRRHGFGMAPINLP